MDEVWVYGQADAPDLPAGRGAEVECCRHMCQRCAGCQSWTLSGRTDPQSSLQGQIASGPIGEKVLYGNQDAFGEEPTAVEHTEESCRPPSGRGRTTIEVCRATPAMGIRPGEVAGDPDSLDNLFDHNGGWSERASGESGIIENSIDPHGDAQYSRQPEEVLNGGIQVIEKSSETGSGSGRQRLMESGQTVRISSLTDLCFTSAVVDGVGSECFYGLSTSGTSVVRMSEFGPIPAPRVSDYLRDPWYRTVPSKWLGGGARARAAVKALLSSMALGEVQGRLAHEPRVDGCSIVFDQPLPYHQGYPVPEGFVTVSRPAAEWWTDVVWAGGMIDSPKNVCDRLIVPNGWAHVVLVPYRREPSVLLSTPALTRGLTEDDPFRLLRVVGAPGGLPIYIGEADTRFGGGPCIVVDRDVAYGARARRKGFLIAGVSEGVHVGDGNYAEWCADRDTDTAGGCGLSSTGHLYPCNALKDLVARKVAGLSSDRAAGYFEYLKEVLHAGEEEVLLTLAYNDRLPPLDPNAGCYHKLDMGETSTRPGGVVFGDLPESFITRVLLEHRPEGLVTALSRRSVKTENGHVTFTGDETPARLAADGFLGAGPVRSLNIFNRAANGRGRVFLNVHFAPLGCTPQ